MNSHDAKKQNMKKSTIKVKGREERETSVDCSLTQSSSMITPSSASEGLPFFA